MPLSVYKVLGLQSSLVDLKGKANIINEELSLLLLFLVHLIRRVKGLSS